MSFEQSEVPTYTATIFCGLREGFDGPVHELGEARAICQRFCEESGEWLGLTLRPTVFIYTGGHEPGIEVGLINYPRCPATPQQIRERAVSLAGLLMEAFQQIRASIVFPDVTVMLGPAPNDQGSSEEQP